MGMISADRLAKELVNLVNTTKGAKSVSLKEASSKARYSSQELESFSDGLTIHVPDNMENVKWSYDGTSYRTLMSGTPADGGEDHIITVWLTQPFARFRTVGEDGKVEAGMTGHNGNVMEYRAAAPTIEEFWKSIQGKTLKISEAGKVTTPNFRRDDEGKVVGYKIGEEVAPENTSERKIWTITVE